MHRSLQNAFAATALTGLSLYLWRIAYISSDWAVLALIPLALVIGAGFWPLALDPWRAQLNLALREDSSLRKFLTGRIRAMFLSAGFTFVAVTLMAWQAICASITDAAIMITAFLLSAWMFSSGRHLPLRHFFTSLSAALWQPRSSLG